MAPLSFLLLLLTAVDRSSSSSSDGVCGYQEVLNYLNMSKDNVLYTMARPVKNHTQPTVVKLTILLYGILDVKETDQTFIPYIWVSMNWINDHISWNDSEFCGINTIPVPTELLWKPDIMIYEMVEKDKTAPSPRLVIQNDGNVFYVNDQVLVSSCRMHIYNFPFDVQSCTLSFSSLVYSIDELQLQPETTSEEATDLSRELMPTQFEWLFIDMTITNENDTRFGWTRHQIIFTINMKRRAVLYIINFILPVLFFLCLDLASFLISDSGGEKLSFKVTVLLAVTVMQLILNEILPASSNRIPLIALYCIGIFALMLLSLLETIIVMYLLEKDKEPSRNQSLSERRGDKQDEDEEEEEKKKRKWNPCVRFCVSTDKQPTELLKVSGSGLMDGSQDSEKLVEDLNEAMKTLSELLTRREGEKSDYWARKTKVINKVFFIFYIITAALFLVFMFFNWKNVP